MPSTRLAPTRWLLAAIILCAGVTGIRSADATVATDSEMRTAHSWAAAHLAAETEDAPATPPLTFMLGGVSCGELLPTWERRYERATDDAQGTQHTLSWTDPQSGLQVRCEGVEYRDFPVIEWTVYLVNTGTTDTPIVENILALDAAWQREPETEFVLHHGVGSPADGSDYGPRVTPLGPGAAQRVSAAGGRPTNTDLSYFNLQWGTQGVLLAVGWPGQWVAEFVRDSERGIRVTAGQELTHFKLLPGEEVRTPRMALLFWQGDRLRSHNLWRRWMMAHNMPRPGGKLPPPQLLASSSRAYEEMIGANEANQIMHIDRYLEEQLPLDYWWMDAGWYIQQQGWPQVGTWEVDPQRFPRGLRPISQHAREHGVKTLVWFEPERVAPGTWLYQQHPEWLLTGQPERDHPLAGMRCWTSSALGGTDPCVTHNPTDQVRTLSNIRWEPGRLSFHPGAKGEYTVVRWTAPQAGRYTVQVRFLAIDPAATTDVHVLHNGQGVFNDALQLDGRGAEATYEGQLQLAAGDTVDCVVGWGNGTHVCDSTGLEFRLTDDQGTVFDAAQQFQTDAATASSWSYGYLPPGPAPQDQTFCPFDRPGRPDQQGQRLLNLGLPAARQWLTEHVDQLLTEQGISLYRQDFNMDPLAFWRAYDEPDRQGITEIKYVTGLLAYWDELRRRHPDMLIDTCASGGRRNDLETLRRAVPLWRSDYAFEPIGHQCMTYGISLWIPYHGTGTVACANASYYGGGLSPVEPYAFWSNTAPSLVLGIDIRRRELDYDTLRRLIAQWRTVSRFYCADYYPLTPYSRDNAVWIAWQFHDPEVNQGTVQAFRRAACDEPTAIVKLAGLDPDAQYEITQFDGAGTTTRGGRDLLDAGLTVSVPDRPGAAVFTYRRVIACPGLQESLQTITDQELMDYAAHLADDAMQGRAMNTPGGRAAGDFLAAELKSLGLRPAAPHGRYIQDCGQGCRNILGLLPGSDPALVEETVLVSAHYDHVGVRPAEGTDTAGVCNGANDNASGVAGVLELAEALAGLPQPPRRPILFALWDGEEQGFVGSRFFVDHPTVALDRITGLVNLDMIGRVVDSQLIIWGTGTAGPWRDIVTASNAGPQLDIDMRPFTLALSDHQPFVDRGIPAILACTGLFPELHRPTDDVELLDPDGMRRSTQLVQGIVCELANRRDRLAFLEAARTDIEHDPRRKADDRQPAPRAAPR